MFYSGYGGGDPGFVNPDAGDYHLQKGCCCIDQGLAPIPEGILTDLDGNPRIVGSGVDWGAYEYQQP